MTNAMYTRASNKKSKSNLDLAAVQVASKKYKQNTGQDFSPSAYRADRDGFIQSKAHRQYTKDRNAARKVYKTKYGL